MTDTHEIPLGHSIPTHRVHGWCSHCPGRSLAEEVGAWQVDALDRTAPSGVDRDAAVERLRTENERLRHELEVMYGGAFDNPPATGPDTPLITPQGGATSRTDAIRARHKAATPGPWGTSRDLNGTYTIEAQPRFIPGSGTVSVNEGIVGTLVGEEYDDRQTYCNARFAAHAREDVPYLLDRIAELEAALASAKEA